MLQDERTGMRLAAIASLIGGTLLGEDRDVRVATSIDSRDVPAGGLFCAFVGENTDGHSHVASAFAAGAAAAIVTDPEAARASGEVGPLVVVDDPASALGRLAAQHVTTLRENGELTVVILTGSVGKTTTKDMLADLLPDSVATAKSFNNEIGFPLTVLRAEESTRHLVLEAGADKRGDLNYLTSLVPPDVALVLVVGRAHLGVFGSIDDVAGAKSELVAGLAPHGIAVLNADDPRVVAMAEVAPGRVVTFGLGDDEVRAGEIDVAGDGHASFTLTVGEETARVRLGLVGEHHVANALGAAAVAHALGRPLMEIAAGLAGRGPASPHRMAITERPDGITIVDDSYNANPDSMTAGVNATVKIAGERRVIAVLGEMLELGDEAEPGHEEIGHLLAERGVAHVIAVGELSRHYGVDLAPDAFTYTASLDEARGALAATAREGDVVLFKGSNGSRIWALADEWVAP